MIKKYFFVLLSSHLIYSQNSKVFKGVLLNKIENKPISFAHFQSPQRGFISNKEGRFELAVNDSIDSLQVFISAIGYSSKHVYLYSTKKNTVYLQSVEVNLEEVVLDYENPARQLIKKVIENIPNNYPNEFEQLYGEINENTFWDSLKTKPIYKANVSIRADKFSYAKKSTIGNIELLDKSVTYHSFDSLDIRFYAGAHRAHYGDFVKARKDILSKKKVKDFEISINDTLSLNKKKVAKLFYKNKQVNGIVYVDLENYAIVRVERFIEPLLIKEPFGFSLRYQRYYYQEVIDYSKGIGDKWRINFMHYTTGFKHKKTEREIHLENTCFIQRIEKGKEVIPLNRRIKFTDVLINKIKPDSVESINKRDRLFRFFDRLRTSISLSLIPVKINPHEFTQPIHETEGYIDYATKILNTFQIRYDYSFENNWGINLIAATSLQKQEYESYALGFWKENEIEISGRWRYEFSTAFENRKLRINHGQLTFQDSFLYENKKFDSGEITYFSEQRDFGLNTRLGLNFRLDEKTFIGLYGSCFFPLNSEHGLYLEEKKEFWFWNKSKLFDENSLTSLHDKIIENDFQFGINLQFRF